MEVKDHPLRKQIIDDHIKIINSDKSPIIETLYESRCLLCGEKTNSFCSSSSIHKAKMNTKNKIYSLNYFLEFPEYTNFPRKVAKVKNAGIFKNTRIFK